MTNCPNCGAPITGRACEYCGTAFHISEPVRSRFEITPDGITFELYSAYKLAGGNGMYGRIISNGLESGILTPNEARKLMDLPRI